MAGFFCAAIYSRVIKIGGIMKKIFLAVIGLLAVLAAYLLAWPVPIDPVPWQPPINRGYVGDFKPNTDLADLERIAIGDIHGPEDIVIQNGYAYVSSQEGKIIRIDLSNLAHEDFADTKGSALGLEFDASGNLIIADAYRGLLSVGPDGHVTTLTNVVDDTPILYADDLDIADDGVIYFSDASTKFGAEAAGSTMAGSLLEILEHGRTGRLLAYDPNSGQTRVIRNGYAFSNGVAIHPDGDILVNETGEYRILKVNPKTGKQTVFIDNLPGFPDNINRGPDDTFLVGIVSKRSDWIDENAQNILARKIALRLPEAFRAKAVDYGFIIQLDANGSVLRTWQDPDAGYPATTGAIMHDGYLYVSSLTAPDLGRKRLVQ